MTERASATVDPSHLQHGGTAGRFEETRSCRIRRERPISLHAGRVHGATGLEAGVLDELEIHQIPVLFGRGLRLFELLPSRVELEIVRVIDTPQAPHINYHVRR